MTTFQLWLFILAFVVVNAVLIILRSKDASDSEGMSKQKTIKQIRTMQATNLRENALLRKFEERVEEKTTYDKRYKVETIAMQSGFPNLSYSEIVIIQYGFILLFGLVSLFVLKNPLLAIVMAFVGKILPVQFMSTIANRRMSIMEKQIGSFIQLITERYAQTGDLANAIENTAPDFRGLEPMSSEIQRTVLDMRVGTPTETAMKNLGRRTGNKFLTLFANYYSISSKLGTEDARNRIVRQAWEQYNEDYKMKQTLREQIAGPKNEAYIMLAFVPIVVVYQVFTNDDYLTFMLTTDMGKIGTTGIIVVLLFSLWFINKKIGAPLE